MAKVRAKWLRLTEETNALDYLEKANSFILLADRDPIAWKWVILCLHTALYGFAICALRGTNPDNVTYTTKKGQQKLITFGDAIERCQNPQFMQMTIMSRQLVLDEADREAVRLLKKTFRDNFEHFIPKGWSIEIHGFPEMAIRVLRMIRFLAFDSGNYIHLKSGQKKRIKSIVHQATNKLKKSRLHQE